MNPDPAAPLAVTMGEPAGIGGDIALKAWLRRDEGLPAFFMIDSPERLAALASRLRVLVPVREIADPADAGALFASALPVLPQPLAAAAEPGRPDATNAGAVIAAIDRGVALVRSGQAAGLVTNPIHKRVLYDAGFRHPGHTEYLAELAGSGARPVMMLACPGLRVVPVTVHLPLRAVAEALSREAIVETAAVAAAALARDFGIHDPRLAVAGLNPHAGEEGSLGREEIDVIGPAVAELCRRGIRTRGPLPADTLFHPAARAAADAVVCMYHDQALVPLKTIDFYRGVNITLGLPFVRTSPDHGTALNIAGTGAANEESLIAALGLAAEMAARRRDG